MLLHSVILALGSGLSGVLAQSLHEQASVVEQLIARTTTIKSGCDTQVKGKGSAAAANQAGLPTPEPEAIPPVLKPVVKPAFTKVSSTTQPAKPLLLVKPTEHGEAQSGILNHKHRHSSTSRRPPTNSVPSQPKPDHKKAAPSVPPPEKDDPSESKPSPLKAGTVAPIPKAAPPPALDSDPFINDVLKAHNTYRWMHGEQPLQWNITLQAYAHDWASRCVWKHSDGDYGENLAEGYPDWAAKFAVKAWYDECNDYDFVHGKYDDDHGHCTQLLWTTTTQVGCANVECPNLVGGHVMSCSYYPAGNIVGDVDHQTEEDVKFFNAHLSPLIHH